MIGINLSTQVLDATGFRKLAEDEHLLAAFHSAHVYTIRGLTIDNGVVIRTQGTVSDVTFDVAVGNSVNQVCKVLIGDELTPDEEAWTKERRCSPPYAVIHYGPTAIHRGEGRHVREEGPLLVTYDSFPMANQELRSLEAAIHSSVVTALACSLGSLEDPAQLLQVERTVYGVTDSGRFPRVIRIQGSAQMYVSRKLSAERFQEALDSAARKAPKLRIKVSRFFHLAMEEKDNLKSFLYFFLAIEIETHASFLSIDHSAHIDRVLQIDGRVRKSATSFFEAQREHWKNLKDRFVWCTVCTWQNMTDIDIENFKTLKKVRDDIAHGTISEPPADSVAKAKSLVIKLLNQP